MNIIVTLIKNIGISTSEKFKTINTKLATKFLIIIINEVVVLSTRLTKKRKNRSDAVYIIIHQIGGKRENISNNINNER